MLDLSAQSCLKSTKVADALRIHGTAGINVSFQGPWFLISLGKDLMGRAY